MKRRTIIYLSILCGLFLVFPRDGYGQATRVVEGVITATETGGALAGVTVTMVGGSNRVATTTAPDGSFRLILPVGATRLVAARLGFAPDTVLVLPDQQEVVLGLRSAALALDEVVVESERSYSAASSSVIRELDINLRPHESSQELLSLAPGVVIAQHAGGGKAEQIFARGFDADHGTDVAISVDGTPVNMVSHAHGQGYADLHFLIPEIVDRLDVQKGPYDPTYGDFATAASVTFRTVDRLPATTLTVRGGSFETGHALALVPFGGDANESGGYVAAAGKVSEGPFEVAQDYRRGNLFAKWTAPVGSGAQVYSTASAFGADWDQSGQIPERLVESGEIGRFGAVDATEGGETERYDVAVGVRSTGVGGARWDVRAYGVRYKFRLFSNFTFFLNDAVNGDGIEQVDDRYLGGFRGRYAHPHTFLGRPGVWSAGVGSRSDRMDVALYHQRERERLGVRVNTRIAQDHFSGWMQQDVQLSPKLRLQLGIRADQFRFEVDDHLVGKEAELPHESGTEWRGIVSPKASLAYDVTPATSLFANVGTGFHSNDARDVILAQEGERVLPRAVGAELGGRHTWTGGSVAAAAWLLDLQSELVFVGDEGVTEPSGRTRRIGIDLEGRARLLPWLWAFADLNLARGRFRDEPPGAHLIPLAPDLTSTGGLTIRDLGPWTAGTRYRLIGSRPADESGTVIAEGYHVWEVFGSRKIAGVNILFAVNNLFNVEWNEAQFATTSRLRDESEPVTELHFTPGAPRSFQVGLEYRF